MQACSGADGSPPKVYKIKLFEKDIKVQLVYKSPPKRHQENKKVNPSISLVSDKEKSGSIMASGTKMDSNKSKNKQKKSFSHQKQFYANRYQQSHNALEKYQEFHNHMAEGKVKCRLRVYSNSKFHCFPRKCSKSGFVPTKQVNIANNIHEKSVNRVVKIKLFVSRKNKQNCQQSAEKTLQPKQHQQRQKSQEVKKQLLTPSRSRKYKLEVTTSKSRGKNDSMMSNRQQLSKEIRRIQLNNYSKEFIDSSPVNMLKPSKNI